MGASRTLCVLTGMVLWRGSGRLKKGTDGQRMSLNRQRGQEQSSFHQRHGRAGSRQGLGTEPGPFCMPPCCQPKKAGQVDRQTPAGPWPVLAAASASPCSVGSPTPAPQARGEDGWQSCGRSNHVPRAAPGARWAFRDP